MKQIYPLIALIWRVPGFILSFMFYRFTRLLILNAAKNVFAKKLKSGEPLQWTAYSESLQIQGALPYMMCTTSRWNPHAPLGSFGPINVDQTLSVDVASPIRSAKGWIITVFRGDFEVVALLYPGNTSERDWKILDLPKDQYRVLVRYYGYHGDTVFPALEADGKLLTESRNVGDEMGESLAFFRENVVNHKGVFYFMTQYYIFQLLRWQYQLPTQLVRRIYLPVGDPQITGYRYGVIEKGQRLHLMFDESLLDRADVYITYCNRWGFPHSWDHATEREVYSQTADQGLVYLVRVVNFENAEPLQLDNYQFYCEVCSSKDSRVPFTRPNDNASESQI